MIPEITIHDDSTQQQHHQQSINISQRINLTQCGSLNGTSLGKSLGRSYGKSFVDSFSQSLLARRGPSPPNDYSHLEDHFCKDFLCCGQILDNLHDLLTHFEEVHVEMDINDDAEDDLPFQFESMDTDIAIDHRSNTALFSTSKKKSYRGNNCNEPPKTIPYTFDLPAHDIEMEEVTTEQQQAPFHSTRSSSQSSQQQKLASPVQQRQEPISKRPEPVQQRQEQAGSGDESSDSETKQKPYFCGVEGCFKRYKNVNGLKYHMSHGHVNGDLSQSNIGNKPFKCTYPDCGKRYKNSNGLKYHRTSQGH